MSILTLCDLVFPIEIHNLVIFDNQEVTPHSFRLPFGRPLPGPQGPQNGATGLLSNYVVVILVFCPP